MRVVGTLSNGRVFLFKSEETAQVCFKKAFSEFNVIVETKLVDERTIEFQIGNEYDSDWIILCLTNIFDGCGGLETKIFGLSHKFECTFM